jgi:hypothetical protein
MKTLTEDFIADVLGHGPRRSSAASREAPAPTPTVTEPASAPASAPEPTPEPEPEPTSEVDKLLKIYYPHRKEGEEEEKEDEDENGGPIDFARMARAAAEPKKGGPRGREPRMAHPTKLKEAQMMFKKRLIEAIDALPLMETPAEAVQRIITEALQVNVPKWFKRWFTGRSEEHRKSLSRYLQSVYQDAQKKGEDPDAAVKSEIEGMETAKQEYKQEAAAPAAPEAAQPTIEEPAQPEIESDWWDEQGRDFESDEDAADYIEASRTDVVEKTSAFNAGLQAFLGGNMTVKELQSLANPAWESVRDLVSAVDKVKGTIGAAIEEAVDTQEKVQQNLKRWAYLAGYGAKAKEGERTRITPLPRLTRMMVKTTRKWEHDQKDPNNIALMADVVGELGGQMQVINMQINKLAASNPDAKIKTPEVPIDDKISVARQIQSKIMRGQPIEGDNWKEPVRKVLHDLMYRQAFTYPEILRILGIPANTKTALGTLGSITKELGIAPGRAKAGEGELSHWRTERMGREGFGVVGPVSPERATIGPEGVEEFGGVSGDPKRWQEAAAQHGIEKEATAALKTMKQRGAVGYKSFATAIWPHVKKFYDKLPPEEKQKRLAKLALSILGKRDAQGNFKNMRKLPTSVAKENVARRLFLPVEPTKNNRVFSEALREFDAEELDEAVAMTEALELLNLVYFAIPYKAPVLDWGAGR